MGLHCLFFYGSKATDLVNRVQELQSKIICDRFVLLEDKCDVVLVFGNQCALGTALGGSSKQVKGGAAQALQLGQQAEELWQLSRRRTRCFLQLVHCRALRLAISIGGARWKAEFEITFELLCSVSGLELRPP